MLGAMRFAPPRCFSKRNDATNRLRIALPSDTGEAPATLGVRQLMARLPCDIALISPRGKFLSAQWDTSVQWNREQIGTWETVTVVAARDDGKVALRSSFGKFLSAQPDGSLAWNGDRVTEWEEFRLIPPDERSLPPSPSSGIPLSEDLHPPKASKLERALPCGSVVALVTAEGHVLRAADDGEMHAAVPPVRLGVSDSAALVVGWSEDGRISLKTLSCHRFVEVSFLLFAVTFYANLAHNLTRSP
jgi:hypothetical protein